MKELRTTQRPTDMRRYLQQLPALPLLDRLPTAMLGLGPTGDIAYANMACAEMLGYLDAETVTHLELPKLLTGSEHLPPATCLDTLQAATSIVAWNHDQGYVIRTVLSPPLRLPAADALLLIGISDVTAWLWETHRD